MTKSIEDGQDLWGLFTHTDTIDIVLIMCGVQDNYMYLDFNGLGYISNL